MKAARNRRSSTVTNLRTLLCRRCGKYEILTWGRRMKQISGRAKFCVVDPNQHNQGVSLSFTHQSVRILVTCVRTSRKIMPAVKPPPHPPLAQQAVQWVLIMLAVKPPRRDLLILLLLLLNKLCSGSWSVFTTFGSGAATVRKQELGQPPWWPMALKNTCSCSFFLYCVTRAPLLFVLMRSWVALSFKLCEWVCEKGFSTQHYHLVTHSWANCVNLEFHWNPLKILALHTCEFSFVNSILLCDVAKKRPTLIKQTSQELQKLSRSLSDCQLLTLNIIVRVFQFVRKGHCVTKSLPRSLSLSLYGFISFISKCRLAGRSGYPLDYYDY